MLNNRIITQCATDFVPESVPGCALTGFIVFKGFFNVPSVPCGKRKSVPYAPPLRGGFWHTRAGVLNMDYSYVNLIAGDRENEIAKKSQTTKQEIFYMQHVSIKTMLANEVSATDGQ